MSQGSSHRSTLKRRSFLAAASAGFTAAVTNWTAASETPFRLRYILSSAMYGTMPLEQIVSEVKATGATALDIWPAPHGNQREQIDEMGPSAFRELLATEGIKLGGIACYRPGPFRLASEMDLARDLEQRGVVLVTGAGGKKEVQAKGLKAAVRSFIEKMKPQIDHAERTGCIIAIENHANDLLETPEGIRRFGELAPKGPFGLAFAPHHLPQDSQLQADLIKELGPVVKFVYAQQHGKGSKVKLPKEDELSQMPGRGPLDFGPIVGALAAIKYEGYTEIFMHPVPRGVPILPTAAEITAEINASRRYLDRLIPPE